MDNMTFQLENMNVILGLAPFLNLSSKDPLKNLCVFNHLCDKSFMDFRSPKKMFLPLAKKCHLKYIYTVSRL